MLQGVMVQQGSETSIMAPADLAKFTKLKPGRIKQRMPMPLSIPFSQASFCSCCSQDQL